MTANIKNVPEKFVGFAALEPTSEKLTKYEFDRPEVKDDDVVIKVSYCGLCYSDVHMRKNNWGSAEYPFVGGHEVVGTVVARGSRVKEIKEGQRVGVGWCSRSCLDCRNCRRGNDQYCKSCDATISFRQGGFADYIVVQSSWAFPIPDEIPSELAGPLMCGGVTVFTPFKLYDIKGPQTVGVYGIGGLGHLALQFAKAYGCEVVALSNSSGKEKEAQEFGASKFVDLSNKDSLRKVYNSIDVILVTGDTGDWDQLINCIKFDGKLIFLGAGMSSINVPVSTLQTKRLTITGCYTGGRADIEDMLKFAAKNNVRPKINLFPFEKIDDGFELLTSGKARYRVVFQTSQ